MNTTRKKKINWGTPQWVEYCKGVDRVIVLTTGINSSPDNFTGTAMPCTRYPKGEYSTTWVRENFKVLENEVPLVITNVEEDSTEEGRKRIKIEILTLLFNKLLMSEPVEMLSICKAGKQLVMEGLVQRPHLFMVLIELQALRYSGRFRDYHASRWTGDLWFNRGDKDARMRLITMKIDEIVSGKVL